MTRKKAVRTAAQTNGIRRELTRETNKILRLKVEIAKNFWDLGNSLVRVHDRKLFQAAGYRGFEGYLKKEVKIGRSTAYRLMELARNFSKETAIRYGQEKLLGAIEYAKATPEEDLPIDVTRYEIEVKGPSGEKTTKKFKKASSKEIKRAAALLRKTLKPTTLPEAVPLPSLAGLLSGKKPKFLITPFLSKVRERLKQFSPRPTVSLKTTKKGKDPLVELRLSNVQASRLIEVFGLLAAAALDVWMESMQ